MTRRAGTAFYLISQKYAWLISHFLGGLDGDDTSVCRLIAFFKCAIIGQLFKEELTMGKDAIIKLKCLGAEHH